MPRWSKLKKQLTDIICDDLKDRVDIYATRYRGTHDELGKVWIELDKKVIFEANTLEWEIEYNGLAKELQQINHCTDYCNSEQSAGYYQSYEDAGQVMNQKHHMNEYQVYDMFYQYLETPFAESLESENCLIRILCMLDKRMC